MSNSSEDRARAREYRRKASGNRKTIREKKAEIAGLERKIERLERAESKLTSIVNGRYEGWRRDFERIKSVRPKDFKGRRRRNFNGRKLDPVVVKAEMWNSSVNDQLVRIRNRISQLRRRMDGDKSDVSNLNMMISVYEELARTLLEG